MRYLSARLIGATLLAVPLVGLAAPATAAPGPDAAVVDRPVAGASQRAAAAGWQFIREYNNAANCVSAGAMHVRTFPGLYGAYYCEEFYESLTGQFRANLYLFRLV